MRGRALFSHAPLAPQVNSLIEAQQKLSILLTSAGVLPHTSGKSFGRPLNPARDTRLTRSACCLLAAELSVSAGGTQPSGLRSLLGRAVRNQAEQQREIDSLRDRLRDADAVARAASAQASASASESHTARARQQQLQEELDTERSERMESEAASLEREEALEVTHKHTQRARIARSIRPWPRRAHPRFIFPASPAGTHP